MLQRKGCRIENILKIFVPLICITLVSCNITEPKEGWTSYEIIEEIWCVDLNGNNNIFLAHGISPQFTSNGEKILFIQQERIHSINPDGTDDQIISPAQKYISDFKTNNDKILYSAFAFSSYSNDIFIMNSDGSQFENLTNTNTGAEFSPPFSHDGLQIIFTEYSNILILDFLGNLKNVLKSDTTYFRNPQFNAYGDKIVYTEYYFSKATRLLKLLYLKNPGKTITFKFYTEDFSLSPVKDEMLCQYRIVSLVDLNTFEEKQLSTIYSHNPSWSQDGSKILFVEQKDIVITNSEQTFAKRIATGKDNINSVAISADNDKIVYSRRYGVEVNHPG